MSGLLHNHAKHDLLSCPQCGETFVCLCNRASDCPCAQVNLTRDESEWISWQTGGDCICIACLMKMRESARQAVQ